MAKYAVCLSHPTARDGIGHQVYNRMEVLALAQALNISYKCPIFESFDYNYGDGILDIASELQILEDLNLTSIPALASCHHKTHFGPLLIKSGPALLRCLIPGLKAMALLLRKNVLIQIDNVGRYLNSGEKFPFDRIAIFSQLLKMELLRDFQVNLDSKNEELKLIVVLPWARNATLKERAVPLDYYTKTLHYIVDRLRELELSYSIKIHTDAIQNLDSNRTRWSLSTETVEYLHRWNISTPTGFRYSYLDIPRIFDFLKQDEFEIVSNVSPVSIWNDFRDSSIIIGSRSALSYSGVFYSSPKSFIILPGNSDIRLPRVKYLDIDFSNFQALSLELETFLSSI